MDKVSAALKVRHHPAKPTTCEKFCLRNYLFLRATTIKAYANDIQGGGRFPSSASNQVILALFMKDTEAKGFWNLLPRLRKATEDRHVARRVPEWRPIIASIV